jgi:hypothetical protein
VRRLAVAAVLVLAACGGGEETTLDRAEDAMAELDAGTMALELSATTPDVAEPVGFRVEGSFSFTSDGELPLLDFDYTELLAGDENVASILSDGETAWVELDGNVTELSDEQAQSLRLGDDEGFADLGIASWVDEPTERQRGNDTVVSGPVDAADLLGDIVRIASQVAAAGEIGPLDEDAADRLAELVRSSTIEVVVGEDDLPRTVAATLDFGGEVPPELEEVLGPYAAAELRLDVELAPLEGELTIEAPG